PQKADADPFVFWPPARAQASCAEGRAIAELAAPSAGSRRYKMHHAPPISKRARRGAKGGESGFDLASDLLDEIDDLVRITPLVVVPSNDLDEGLVELDASLGVEHAGADLADEVGRDDCILGVTEHALHLALRSSLHRSADLVVAGFLDELGGHVDDRDVRGRNAECHAGE